MSKPIIVRVQFGTSAQGYDYKTFDTDLKRGDYVITDSSTGVGIAQVVTVNVPKKVGMKYAWLLGKVDVQSRRRKLHDQQKEKSDAL